MQFSLRQSMCGARVKASGRRYAGVALALLTLLAFAGGARSHTALAANSTAAIWKIYAPGWNLVAGPGGSRLGLHNETLYSLNGSASQYSASPANKASAGTGYWVDYPQGAMLLLIGTPQSVTTVHVSGGNWAILGNSGTQPATVRGADIALTYDPLSGFTNAGTVQTGQAVLVYDYDDADVFLDPFSPASPPGSVMPRSLPPAAVPALPSAQGVVSQPGAAASATPVDELNYLYSVNPTLSDVEQQLSHFADNIGLGDPQRPNDPVWQSLKSDAAQVAQDLALIQALSPPSRYVLVNADLVAALSDISDGMSDTISGLLTAQPDRVTLGSGLLEAGARRLETARGSLPQ